jgi:hypothetical protein
LLSPGCATTEVREGQTGAVAWEVVDKAGTESDWEFTVVLRETAGTWIQFTKLNTAVPLPPVGWGREYYGGLRERFFVRRLERNSELRARFNRLSRHTSYLDLEFVGVDEAGKPIHVGMRVFRP